MILNSKHKETTVERLNLVFFFTRRLNDVLFSLCAALAVSICFLLTCAGTQGKSQQATLAKPMRNADNLSLTDAIHSFAEKLHRVSGFEMPI